MTEVEGGGEHLLFEGRMPDIKEIDQLRYQLQREEIQASAEFEAKALELNNLMANLELRWRTEVIPAISSIYDNYKALSCDLTTKLQSPQHSALKEIIELEQERRRIIEAQQEIEYELEWRTAKQTAVKALGEGDLDTAQQAIQDLDGIVNQIKQIELDELRKQFIALVRSS